MRGLPSREEWKQRRNKCGGRHSAQVFRWDDIDRFRPWSMPPGIPSRVCGFQGTALSFGRERHRTRLRRKPCTSWHGSYRSLSTALARRMSGSSSCTGVVRLKAVERNQGRRVQNCKREQKVRKNPRDGQGYEHQGNEHHSVQYASGDDRSAAREATEQIEPANDHHGHAHYADGLSARSSKSRKSAPTKPETAPTMSAKTASTRRLPWSPSGRSRDSARGSFAFLLTKHDPAALRTYYLQLIARGSIHEPDGLSHHPARPTYSLSSSPITYHRALQKFAARRELLFT
jgi:hypothetical protein